jgi:EAL domain-containing protein (putative c-di-GMP-specific phosphodiesterase class I)
LDDFGSGLSSFGYLKTLPADILKIDGFFVRDITDDPVDLALVRTINEIAHLLGKKTVAEYVENDSILEILKSLGVDYGQGYGIYLPQPLERLC